MRRWLIPEAIQTSAMDCGPASLKALLEGFGIHASYGRLREACQTDVDGTSIDQVEDAAVALGLDAAQVMLPADHLFAPESEALPALGIVRQANGAHHFVVFWRRHGKWIQVMDPAVGRRWTRTARIQSDLYVHRQDVPAGAWREWAGSDFFLRPLAGRIRRVGAKAGPLIERAVSDPGPRSLARLDAATRMTASLAAAGAVRPGREGGRLLENLACGTEAIAEEYWSAVVNPERPESVAMRGAVLVQARGRKPPSESLSTEMAAVLSEKPARPLRNLLSDLGGWFAPGMLAGALALAAGGAVVEAVLLRGFFDLGRELTSAGQRVAALALLSAFGMLLLALDFLIAGGILRVGRQLEARLRVRFLAKIPRLADRYFQSRLVSDMAERCHSAHRLREGPDLAAAFLRAVFGMACTLAGIGWLYPESLWPAAALAALALGIPLAAQPMLAESDWRLRTHTGALTRYYLDALQGLTAIRAHGAERAVRREQLALLGEWARAGFALQRTVVAVEGLQFGLSLAAAVWLVWSRLAHGGSIGSMLLLTYWVLNLPAMGEEAAAAAWQYPMLRNLALRLTEPLGAPENGPTAHPDARRAASALREAVAIRMESLSVRAAGAVVLENISLEIAPGSHVAIVGPSGAGKSSLVGLLLGWHRPASGSLLVDGAPLEGTALEELRGQTAWVDPQVQLWNRGMFANLRYGAGVDPVAMDAVVEQAELAPVLAALPDGLATYLGEGGCLLSAGEGQRVRLGRAMSRAGVRLAILDEPARGLDRERRRALMDRAREHWKSATLLAITHDVAGTLDFERVLVIENGGIVEDGDPRRLAGRPDSRYRQLLDAEEQVRRGLWSSAQWRRVRIGEGKLAEARREVYAGQAR